MYNEVEPGVLPGFFQTVNKRTMTETQSLKGHFLIAMPALQDPNFFHSVTYICEHNEDGAMGIVINRRTNVTVGEILAQLGLQWPQQETADMMVYQGGPVDTQRGFVLHQPVGEWDATLEVEDGIGVTSSLDILEALSRNEGPDRVLVSLGYAGWGPGQLEEEIVQNAWLSGPADSSIIFDLPDEERWQAAATLLGVDLSLLSNDVGHG